MLHGRTSVQGYYFSLPVRAPDTVGMQGRDVHLDKLLLPARPQSLCTVWAMHSIFQSPIPVVADFHVF